MDTNDYILMCMERSKDLLLEYLKDLSLEQTCYQPSRISNSISWIVWHTSRGFDRRISLLDEIEQVWMTERWYEKYKLPASDKDVGIGHTTEDISKIRPSNVSDLINYYESINKKMIDFFNSEKSKNLNIKIKETVPKYRMYISFFSIFFKNKLKKNINQIGYLKKAMIIC